MKAFWSTRDKRMIRLYHGDVVRVLAGMPTGVVQTAVTSPPYWGLRDYGTDKSLEIGSEKTPDKYVAKMVEVFQEVRRVLRDDGTVWLNLGDTYGGGKVGRTDLDRRDVDGFTGSATGQSFRKIGKSSLPAGNLVGIPWRVALALQADGWILRQDIIWAKPNPMPESVRNRCTKAHEYLFLLAKRSRYFYDADAIKEKTDQYTNRSDLSRSAAGARGIPGCDPNNPNDGVAGRVPFVGYGANKRSVWTIPTAPYPEAHFATFPPKLVEPCIKAGTSEWGCCPKCRAPWERVVSRNRVSTMPALDNVLDKTGMANRDPERHVTKTNTIGWRPGCECYKVEVIENPPTKPSKSTAMVKWRRKMEEWQALWKKVWPRYQRLRRIPCTVLDPFIGSGTTAKVAIAQGRRCWGIDLSKKYLMQQAVPRIKGALLDRPALAHLTGQKVEAVSVGERIEIR